MKRLGIAATILVIGLAGCDSDNPNSPSGDITIFTVQLSALNEVPPVTNAETSARGTAVITVNANANTIDFNVSLNGLTPTSTITAAHIHPGAAGVNGSPLVNLNLTSGSVVLTNGAGTITVPAVATNAANIQQILAAPQNFYFNVHTTTNPGGVIRGQLR